MSGTTETEIFGILAENLRLAAEDCAVLAWHPRRGWVYNRFRKSLKIIDGACQQAYYWRNYDARWLQLGLMVQQIHQRAGDWLRNSPTRDDRAKVHPMFGKLGDILRGMHLDAEQIRTAATGQPGPILPAPRPAPHRDTRPVQVPAHSGLILPAGFVDRRRSPAM